MRHLLPLCLVLQVACVPEIRKACPSCVILSTDRLSPPTLRKDTERVYVLVPGILGYGWEWDGVQATLEKTPHTEVLVLPWEPWGSLHAGGKEIAAGLRLLLRRLPPSAREVVVIGHSVGGLTAALAGAFLSAPRGVEIQVITIGAPFAGTHISVLSYEDGLHTPSFFAIGGTFGTWPPPGPGIKIIVYPTDWPNDPVMRPRMGHDPKRRSSLPRGAELRSLPPQMDHNVAVLWVAERLREAAERKLKGQR